MRHLDPRKTIISACLSVNGTHRNARATCELAADLALAGIPFREVVGVYKGVREASFVTWPESDDHSAQLLALAVSYGQESILHVHPDRTAELEYVNGARRVIGQFQQVSEAEAEGIDHTHDEENGAFYAVV